MALINCDFYSEALGLSTSMKVILPEEGRQDPKQGFWAMD